MRQPLLIDFNSRSFNNKLHAAGPVFSSVKSNIGLVGISNSLQTIQKILQINVDHICQFLDTFLVKFFHAVRQFSGAIKKFAGAFLEILAAVSEFSGAFFQGCCTIRQLSYAASESICAGFQDETAGQQIRGAFGKSSGSCGTR